jgi:hypothetical protein
VALCAPLATGQAQDELTQFLGVDTDTAASFAESLLEHPHPLIGSAAGLWVRRDFHTEALRQWIAQLPEAVKHGDLPSQAALDAWAKAHSLGLIEHFPLVLDPETALVLATAFATRVSWEQPFDVVPASELGPDSSWSSHLHQVLRTPRHGHSQFIATTTQAGDIAVHTASVRGGLQVVSVIADREVSFSDVLAAAHDIATATATGGEVARRSLFDVPLGQGPLWTVTERQADTPSPDGLEQHCTAVLPAWSAGTNLNLSDPSLGFAAAAALLARALGLVEYRYQAQQAAVARYSRVGFEAAAVTGLAMASAARRRRPGRRRDAVLSFGHPYAVVAVATENRRARGDLATIAFQPWHGVPVFSAWVSEPSNAEDEATRIDQR